MVKDENSDVLADSYNILNRWKELLLSATDVHKVDDKADGNTYSSVGLRHRG
jgi:hypothetical protein